MRAASCAVLASMLLAGLAPSAGCAADPSALWKIVHDQCVPNQEKTGEPDPCTRVELEAGVANGYALLKDIRGVAQFLLIPTARISGIEDPLILLPDSRNYWAPAWEARYLVEDRLETTLPRDGYALAINSQYGRTQDQLHIHIDCIRPDVRQALKDHLAEIGTRWAPFPVPLAGNRYRAIRINQETLQSVDPFRVLADADPEAAANMGRHTLVLVGQTFADGSKGFALLDSQATTVPPDPGSGERLEDHSCAVARR
ncbi:CDP-diacylglycerol diphosphatase [Rhodopila sp.]|jgi:CDP-diacylglycerol pyrophosphatase|uniref:CDP-diacylglycerol diphosphatase n=1 Tax=Rhodopila sp. TaxID=2480087 RepID=UPI002B98DC2C|nr:CDP-diacylglycerol diphosphatase [Rhodopila sp.]HVZ09655.1 CDP-diacylglycerol diphosphatase [Rhodopila sp.]